MRGPLAWLRDWGARREARRDAERMVAVGRFSYQFQCRWPGTFGWSEEEAFVTLLENRLGKRHVNVACNAPNMETSLRGYCDAWLNGGPPPPRAQMFSAAYKARMSKTL